MDKINTKIRKVNSISKDFKFSVEECEFFICIKVKNKKLGFETNISKLEFEQLYQSLIDTVDNFILMNADIKLR